MRAAAPASEDEPYPSASAWPPRCAQPCRWTPRSVAEAAAARGLAGPAIGEAVRTHACARVADALATI
jgi:hypothetical protein